jgi:hypothetical protein
MNQVVRSPRFCDQRYSLWLRGASRGGALGGTFWGRPEALAMRSA